jgi:hypothetical protein
LSSRNCTYEKPASDIRQLLEFLQGDNPEKYLFRGQTRDYPTAIPSAYRTAVVKGTEQDAVVGIDPNQCHATLTERTAVKFDVLNLLISILGKGVGNIVAQQYGLTSEALDMTDDPTIAAYFATRTYPSYEHFSGSTEVPIGVVYRFPKRSPLWNKTILDFATYAIGQVLPGYGPVWFWPYHKRWELRDIGALTSVEEVFAETGKTQLTLFTHPIVVDYEKAREWIEGALKENGFIGYSDYEKTRLFRQRGSFVRLAVNWVCTIPDRVEIVYVEKV